MNREILFRGQKINSEEWVYGSLVETNRFVRSMPKQHTRFWVVVNSFGNGGWFNVCSRFHVKTKTVGQFTGLKDKNGKNKVFESDKVKYNYWIQTSQDPDSAGAQYSGVGIVVFIEGSFMVEDIKTKKTIPLQYQDLCVEVVGNIHG